MRYFLIFCSICVLIGISGCDAFRSTVELRFNRAAVGEGDIHIGVAWPLESLQSLFREGVELAVDTVNRQGGINGREIVLRLRDDGSSVTQGLIIAQEMVDDLDIVAVIGHYDSYISLPTSTVYNNGGVLMISPSSTSPLLTQRDLPLVFRNIPNDHEFGRQLAHFASHRGYNRTVIYYINNPYGRGLANAFEDRIKELGLDVVDRLPYDGGSLHEFLQALDKWRFYDYDAIFLAGTMPEAAEFIVTARENGIKVPVFGGDGLDNMGLINIAGKHAEGVKVASIYNAVLDTPENNAFVEAFRKKYDHEPDMWAAQGYDALMILAEGMKKAGSSVPVDIAEALKSMGVMNRITGTYHFDEKGDVQDKQFFIRIVEDGRFSHLMCL